MKLGIPVHIIDYGPDKFPWVTADTIVPTHQALTPAELREFAGRWFRAGECCMVTFGDAWREFMKEQEL